MQTLTSVFQSYVSLQVQRAVRGRTTSLEAPLREVRPGVVLFFDVSGFTSLCERFARRGPVGIDALTTILDAYFGMLIGTVLEHGGDVLSSAGDAMICVWYGEDLAEVARRAAQCGLALQSRMAETATTSSEKLELKVALDVGEVALVYTGGERDRWECYVSGSALRRICQQQAPLASGRVMLSPDMATLLGSAAQGRPQAGGWLHLSGIRDPLPPRREPRPELPAESEGALKALLPAAIRSRIEAGHRDWLAELRQVTVLFINLPGLSEQTLLAQAHQVMTAIQRAIYRFEGGIYQFSVDDKGVTVIATFGLPPLSHEDDAQRGALAALAVQDAVRELGLRCSLGITTGQVFSGTVGNQERRVYTLIGDVMNLAARIMAEATDDILCDKATQSEGKTRLEFEVLPPRKVRGRTEPVPMFRPRRRSASVAPIPELSTLIGRDKERAQLAEALRQLRQERTGRLVVIEGEAGIGKSRLIIDLLAQADRLGVSVMGGAADAFEKSTAWFAWRPLVAELLGPGAREPARREDVLRALGGQPDMARFAPLLNAFLSAELPETDVTSQMTGEMRSESIIEVVLALLRERARSAPLLVLMEDTHWLDSASWKLLNRVRQELPGVLLVITRRPYLDSPTVDGQAVLRDPAALRLELEALSPQDSLELARRRLGVEQLPEALATLMRDKATGNPFFCEELLRELTERRAIVVEDGKCRLLVADLGAISLPTTLQGVITSRIDRAPPHLQLPLKVASVIGRVFDPETLRAIYPVANERPLLESYLKALDTLGFTPLESPLPHLQYIFKHVITRDVAYNLMLFTQRRDLHRALAELIESKRSDEIVQFLPLLAHHWTMADDKPRALSYLMRAAKQALDSYANPEVISFLAESERLEGEGGRLAHEDKVHRAHMRAEALLRLGKHEDSLREYSQALQLLGCAVPGASMRVAADVVRNLGTHVWRRVVSPPPPRTTGRERLLQAAAIRRQTLKLYFFAGQPLSGLHTLLRNLNEAEEAGPSNELVNVWAQASAFFSTLGLQRIARSYYDSAQRALPGIEDLVTVSFTQHILGLYHLFAGEWTDASRLLEKAVALDEQLGARQTEAGLHPRINLSIVWLYTGRHRESLATFEEVAAGARRSGYSVSEIQAHAFLAELERRGGRPDAAREHAERALHLIGTQQFPAEKLIALSVLALTQHRAQAWGSVRETTSLLKFTPGLHYSLYLGLSNVVQLHLQMLNDGEASAGERQESERAIVLAIKALHGFTRVFPFGGPSAWLCEAQWARRQGRRKAALTAVQRSLTLARSLKMPYEEAQALFERATCTDDPRAREQDLAEAGRLLASINASPGSEPAPPGIQQAS